MLISTVQQVEKELHASHVHSRMHPSERHINPAGMGGEGNNYYVLVIPWFNGDEF